MLLVRNDPEHERRLSAKFAQFGIRPEQLLFVPQTSQAAYLEYHHSIDLMLDPFPYNGGVTTWDALWMGVPVLTLAGDSYVSRQGVNLLKHVGIPEYIAMEKGQLIAKALACAKTGKRTDSARRQLRDQLQRSPLMDYAGYGKELGQALIRLIG